MKKLIAAKKLAEHCMAKRQSRQVTIARAIALRDMQEARDEELEEQAEFIVSKMRVRVKRYLSWNEMRDTRTNKRVSKRKERAKAIARRQTVILIEI